MSFFRFVRDLIQRLTGRWTDPALRVQVSGVVCFISPEFELFSVKDVSRSGFLVEVPQEKVSGVVKFLNSRGTVTVELFSACRDEGLSVRVRPVAVVPEGGIAFTVVSKGRDRREYERFFEKLQREAERMGSPVGTEATADNFLTTRSLVDYYTIQEKIESIRERRLARGKHIAIFVLVLFVSLGQNLQSGFREMSLRRAISSYETETNSKVLMLVNRRVSFTLFGFPVLSYLTIEDAHSMLRELSGTPGDRNLVILVHTPGGELTAAMQIARILKNWQADVKVVVPYYAMSAGTLIALSAKEIVMDENANLGPIDPQIPGRDGRVIPATAVLDVERTFGRDRLSGDMLILWSMSKRALNQMESFLRNVVLRDRPEEVREEVIRRLLYTPTTHDYPLFAEDLKRLGLPVRTGIPQEIKRMIDLAVPIGGNGRE